MKNVILFTLFLFFISEAVAQNVGINTPSPTSSLDINGGLRLRQQITPVTGANVMLTSNRAHHVLSGTGTVDFTISFTDATLEGQHVIITNNTLYKGFLVPIYIQPNTTVELIYSNAAWKLIGSNEPAISTAWGLAGNNIAFSNFIGTLNDAPLLFKTSNADAGGMGRWGNVVLGGVRSNNFFTQANSGSIHNTAIGDAALQNGTVMYANTAVGFAASQFNINGNNNTAIGHYALNKNKNGTYVVAIGKDALINDTAAEQTVAIGGNALYWNNNRFGNTAVGTNSLFYNSNPDLSVLTATEGLHNTALGHSTLFSNRRGSGNVAIGYQTLYSDVYSGKNIAIGFETMKLADGSFNIAIGAESMKNSINSNSNIAIGSEALGYSNEVRNSIAIGRDALRHSRAENNIAIGNLAMDSDLNGSQNVAIGESALSNTKGIKSTCISIPGFPCPFQPDNGGYNTALGYGTGGSNINGYGNVFIGFRAGFGAKSSRKLYINSQDPSSIIIEDSSTSLIYGDFAADSLLLNAKTINKFSLNVRGSNALEMGYGANNKQTDAGKICYGCFGDPAHWLGIVGGGTAAFGSDRVIKLWSEGGLRIKGNALPNTDNGHSLGQSGLRWSSVWSVNGTINTSDANLKTNIHSSPYGLDEVMQMKPVQYNWKTNPDEDLQIGFLAQDIQKIIPEAVVVPANGDPLGMKYIELIPVLVKAIQELKKENEQYKKRIEKLEAIKK